MHIVLSLFYFISVASFAYAGDALITFSAANETQIALQDWETGKIKQKYGYKINAQSVFYHPPSQKLLFFAPDSAALNIYTASTNTLLNSNLNMDIEFVAYLTQKDLFIAQDKQNHQLMFLQFSMTIAPQFSIIEKIPFNAKLTSYFNAVNNKFYFMASNKLYLVDSNQNLTPHEIYDFKNNMFNKIIAVLEDNSIFLQSNDSYIHIDLVTKKIKDLKKGFLTLAETPDIIFMSHRGDQHKNMIIFKKERNVKQNFVKNPAEKIIFTPDHKNIYFLTKKTVKLYKFKENTLIHKFSFSKEPGQINLFFITP